MEDIDNVEQDITLYIPLVQHETSVADICWVPNLDIICNVSLVYPQKNVYWANIQCFKR